MIINTTISNISAISWRPVLVVEEAGKNHRPWASNLVIGLYELLVNPTTNSLSHPISSDG
jgi:hypothetical protein